MALFGGDNVRLFFTERWNFCSTKHRTLSKLELVSLLEDPNAQTVSADMKLQTVKCLTNLAVVYGKVGAPGRWCSALSATADQSLSKACMPRCWRRVTRP